MTKLTFTTEMLQLSAMWAKYLIILSVGKGMVYPYCELKKKNLYMGCWISEYIHRYSFVK